MKRSAMVRLGLTSAMAAALTGCGGRKEISRCVDENNRVVEDRLCGDAGQSERTGGHGFGPVFLPYRWYYGGAGYALGSMVGGGGYSARPGSTVVRGGFGGTGEGVGGGA